VTSIARDADGYMWFGTNNGLNRYDGNGFIPFFSGSDTNSLPENKIVKLYLSDKGDLWVGMLSKGICRYNSKSQSFVRYRLGDNPDLWTVGTIRGIAEDKDSVLYVATQGGLFCLLPGSDEFTGIPVIPGDNADTVPAPEGLLNPSIAAIAPDEHGGLWIAYDDWRLSYFSRKNNSFRHFSLQHFLKENQQILITSLFQYNGRLWIGSQGPGFIVFDPGKGTSEVLLKEENLVTVGQISPSSQKDLLWLCTGSGLVNYNTVTGKFSRFTYIRTDQRSLSTTSVASSFEDDRGLIWVGTINSGINYAFKDKPFRHLYTGLDTYYSLTQENVTAILHDKNGDMWVGYTSGLVEYNKNNEQRKYAILVYSLAGSYGAGTIFDLMQDSTGDIYCASWEGGLQKFDRSTSRFVPVMGSAGKYLQLFDGMDIRDIEEDKNGRLWLCMHGKGVYVFDKYKKTLTKYISVTEDTNTISNEWVFDICIDDEGYVWVGSSWGLSRISPRDNTVSRYINWDENKPVLTNNSIQLVTKDNLGNIWVGTDDGLNLFDRKTDSFHRFDIFNGLPANQIRSMEQDNSGNYWVSTASGIFMFTLGLTHRNTPVILSSSLFDKHDGLQSDNFYLHSSSKDYSGICYFGGTQGMDFFNPSEIRPVRNTPDLRISSFEIFGKPVYPGTTEGPPINKEGIIELNHRQNLIGIEYVALNYFESQGNVYSYELLPLQSNWINAGNNRKIVLSNLDPGAYSLSLRVVSENGLVNESGDILRFTIKPPYWQTAWFRYMAILLLTGIIVITVRVYTANLRKKKVQLESLVNKRTEELLQKNVELEAQSAQLNETNILLTERQKKITEQAEELKVQSDMLAKSNQDLSMLNTTKDRFFSIISHDLKNPFNTIIGFTKLLLADYDHYADAKRKQLIGYIHDSVTGAYSLLENLLHWSRSQTNRLQIKPADLLVEDIIQVNVELINPMLKKKNLKLTATTDKDLTVWADRELINTVVRNLLTNAIKYTPEGGGIKINSRKAEDNHVCFEVRDTGVGMEKEDMENIFRIDVAKKKNGTDGEEGTGLGMILCKEFIEKMGGQIWLESSRNNGTSVFFTLPFKQPSP